MYKILIIEDSRIFIKMLREKFQHTSILQIVVAETLQDAKTLLQSKKDDFFLALVDINLPDASHGECVDLVIQHNIPVIVFTGEFNEELRSRMIAKRVVDYIVKGSMASLQQVVNLVDRLIRNHSIQVLVVDDSRSARSLIVDLLKSYKFQVLEAENGAKAMKQLEDHPEIRMVITDYHMPVMDGFELTRQIRQKHDKNQLAIIGLSSFGNNILSARFLKRGANDFITKPFVAEEFFVRVTQNIEIIEYIQALKEAAVKDFLTGLPNRRHFMTEGEKLHAIAKKGTITLIAGAVDVDFFKKVNDTYGHEAGDHVLKKVAGVLANHANQTALAARMGGEEFGILLINRDAQAAKAYFETLRTEIEALVIDHHTETIHITASFGVCTEHGYSLADMLDRADQKLYDAKKNGRNRVEFAE